MRIIACDRDAAGPELAQSMFDLDGRVLWRAGVRLTARRIDLPVARGSMQVPVCDADHAGIDTSGVIRGGTGQIAAMAVHRVLREARAPHMRLAVGQVPPVQGPLPASAALASARRFAA